MELGNVIQIKNVMVYLLNNLEKAYELEQNERKEVIQEYNWKTQEKKYIQIISQYDVNSSK